MNTTVKVVLHKVKRAGGNYPIVIRITKEGITAMTEPLFNIPIEEWDANTCKVKSTYRNARRFNSLVATRFAEIEAAVLDIERQKLNLNAFEIRDRISGIGMTPYAAVPKTVRFFEYAKKYLEKLEGRESFNQRDAEAPRIKVFRAYLNDKDISFDKIDKAFLMKFESHLRVERRVSDRTIANYMMMIQAVFKVAIDEKAIPKGSCPISGAEEHYSIFVPESMKIGLNLQDLKTLYNYLPKTPGQQRALDVWFTSFFFAGMRGADVLRLRWTYFYDGRMRYRMGKNKKLVSVKIPEEIYAILARYEHCKRYPDDYIFPDLKDFYGVDDPERMTRRIRQAIFNYDRTLNERIIPATGITRTVSLHIARHTFGTEAKRKGVSTVALQGLYRHSSIRTTEKYQNSFDTDLSDDALERVVNF